jgi:hypothetical protein
MASRLCPRGVCSSDQIQTYNNSIAPDLDYRQTNDGLSYFPLFAHERSIELIDHLTALSLTLSKEIPGCAASTSLAQGMILLEPCSVQRYVVIYFREWHQHSPGVHKGSFDPNTVKLSLLLAIVLIGALYSLSPQHVEMARGMLFLAEQFAFRDQTFAMLAARDVPSSILDPHACLQATQAAFLMALIQLREGVPEKRKQVRSVLFDTIISVSHPTLPMLGLTDR